MEVGQSADLLFNPPHEAEAEQEDWSRGLAHSVEPQSDQGQ